ncbi:MAG: hypothetical protein CMJ45_13585 [Planctomyces sp.]|nr:hypothetical protein [Planctomyces sp.]
MVKISCDPPTDALVAIAGMHYRPPRPVSAVSPSAPMLQIRQTRCGLVPAANLTRGLALMLLVLALTTPGCRLTRGSSELTPLTDDLADRLQRHVRGVLRRAEGKDASAEDEVAKTSSADAVATAAAAETVFGPSPAIQGAGYSRRPIADKTADEPAAKDDSFPARLALPMVGRVPDMARRLIPTLPLWPSGEQPDESAEMTADTALAALRETARVEIEKLSPGDTPAQRQRFIRKHVILRLLAAIDEQPQDALVPIPGLANADQEFWQNIFWAQANYFETESMPEPDARATGTIDRLDAAIRSLQPRARLVLKHLALCRQIHSFGDYEAFEENEYSPGQEVLLYTEIENFTSQPTSDGRQRTLLKSMITIQKDEPSGEVIQQIRVGATEDLCRSTRRDYFHNYEFKIPRSLPLGRYVLTLHVTDLLGNKTASESLKLTVR